MGPKATSSDPTACREVVIFYSNGTANRSNDVNCLGIECGSDPGDQQHTQQKAPPEPVFCMALCSPSILIVY